MMDMSMGMGLLPQQQMKASPALIALNNMLVLSTLELQQLVQQELEENPALDQTESDDTLCSRCGRPLPANGATCIYCLHEDLKLAEAEREDASAAVTDDEFDPLLAIAAPISLQETLQRDLHIALPAQDHPIVDYLIGSLDDQGFLDGTSEEIADTLRVDTAQVELVLSKLQELGPAGVGARNVQECLLIQIDRLERMGVHNPYLRRIVADYWFDLGEHRYGAIAQALDATYDDVLAARDFMRQNLRPFPLERGGSGLIETSFLAPDVIIREEDDRLVVEVVESRRFYLRLNPVYQDLAQSVSYGRQEISSEEREHLSTFVSRARLFLINLRQRHETIRRIGEYLVERQEAFLRHGVRHLSPLTRAEVASAIGVHESTVSRATANKFVQIPSREIIPFSNFFTPSLSIKDVIQELIAKEETPLTDQDIVEILRQRGFDVARRTVAKYRGQLGILPSTLR